MVTTELCKCRLTSQLPSQLATLCKASGAEGVAFGDQASRWVDDGALATVGDVAISDQFMRFALLREPKAFEKNELIGREAVVELADFHVLRRDTSLFHSRLGRAL